MSATPHLVPVMRPSNISTQMTDSPSAPNAAEAAEIARLEQAVRRRLFGRESRDEMIGRFRVLECIGRGGMGIVYLAQDEQLDRKVAIKLLRPELSNRKGMSRLNKEARALAQLSHPNVVGVYDVGEHDGQLFIAMEYVRGQTLRAWCAGRGSVGEVIEVFIEAGRGLAAAHAVGLVHRDFKPDNVLVGIDGRPRVLDFGLARPPEIEKSEDPPELPDGSEPTLTALTHDGALIGTPAYMAPEQHLGLATDARSDQFAFCVSLYEALYGLRPFAGDTVRTLSLSIVRGVVSPPERSDVPRHVVDTLVRGLNVDPNQRFASMEALLEALAGRGSQALALRQSTSAQEVPNVAPLLVEREDEVTLRVGLMPRPNNRSLEAVTHELQRGFGQGRVGRAGGGYTWSSSALDAVIDPLEQGAALTLHRKVGQELRKKLRRGMLLGGVTGFWAFLMFTIFVAEGIGGGAVEVLIPLAFFSFPVGGGFLGRRLARQRHQTAVQGERTRLQITADRVQAVVRAQDQASLVGEWD